MTHENILVEIDFLPSKPRLLALLNSRSATHSFLLADFDDAMKSFTTYGDDYPAELNVSVIGPIADFLTAHKRQVDIIVLAGGAGFNELSLARAAAALKADPSLDPFDVVARTIEISSQCLAYVQELDDKLAAISP